MTLTFVQGDTAPDLTATLYASGNTSEVIDLTDCTVRFQMRKSDDKRFTVNGVADIISAPAGQVRYQWGANDLDQPGTYLTQWEITFDDDRVQTSDPPEAITVRRQ